MEHKFKTIYQTELVGKHLTECIPIHSLNKIMIISGYNQFCAIGRLRDDPDDSNRLPILPVFPYLNLNDSEGIEVYAGHKIILCDTDRIRIIRFWDKRHQYGLFTIENNQVIDVDPIYILRNLTFKVFGHEALENAQ